jgi:hypothetical protein
MELKEKMELLVRQHRESGLNKKAFCREQGINYHRFDYWYRKTKNSSNGGTPGFLKVDTRDAASGAAAPDLEIFFPNGVKVSTGSGDLELVAKLIRLY